MVALEIQHSDKLRIAFRNITISRSLVDSARRVVSRSRALCQAIHERRRHPDVVRHLAHYAPLLPQIRRFLPICGAHRDLEIQTEERPQGLVVHIAGEVDLVNVDRFREALQHAAARGRNLILDLTFLRYIDSTGLHVLIAAEEELRRNGGRLIVAGASAGVAKVVRILHLDARIPLVSSLGEAIDLIRLTSPGSAADGS